MSGETFWTWVAGGVTFFRNYWIGLPRSAALTWRRARWTHRTRSSEIQHGIEAVRRRLKRADGSVHLRIHARCVTLIDSLMKYHYPPDRPDISQPVKDGPDHACDALRYLIVNLDHASRKAEMRRYT